MACFPNRKWPSACCHGKTADVWRDRSAAPSQARIHGRTRRAYGKSGGEHAGDRWREGTPRVGRAWQLAEDAVLAASAQSRVEFASPIIVAGAVRRGLISTWRRVYRTAALVG